MGRKFVAVAMAAALSLVAMAEASAGPATDALSVCLADSTTGKDRKDLARWMFAGVSAHPEMRSLSKVTPEMRDNLDRNMGGIVTRLLTEDCSSQAALAMEQDGSESFEKAFGSIGRLAMQELMSNQDVTVAFSGYEKYLDKARFDAVFSKK